MQMAEAIRSTPKQRLIIVAVSVKQIMPKQIMKGGLVTGKKKKRNVLKCLTKDVLTLVL